MFGGHLTVKCVAAVVLFIVSVFFGLLPIKFLFKKKRSEKDNCSIKDKPHKNKHKSKIPRRDFIMGLCNCFAGGVFFSTCILDLLPMVRKKMVTALKRVDIETEFPLGEFIAGYGFLLMLITELLVHSIGKNSFLVKNSHGTKELKENVEAPLLDNENGEKDDNYGSTNEPRRERDDSYGSQDEPGKENMTDSPQLWKRPSSAVTFADDNTKIAAENLSHSISTESSVENEITQSRIHRSKSLLSIETVTHSNFRVYILVIALSLHSLFEGLAVGLATDVTTLVQILIALIIHKSILAFSLGVKLLDGKLSAGAVLKSVVLFAGMAPLGMGLGIAVLGSFSQTISLFFSGVLQGIATGTFLYVTFFEVLPHELNISDDKKQIKVLFVIIGFTVIACICYYENRHYKKILHGKH